MKRKITSAILICLGLGFLWQAPADPPGNCDDLCRERYRACLDEVKRLCDGFPPCPNRLALVQTCGRAYHSCVGNCVH